MDEHAGPGVFFSNNNNSALQSGGAGKNGGAEGSGGEAASAHYSIPGILHFLQHEWARFELERAQWELERAELQAQVAFLHGERKGQENLKKDLVRRIKMLEYALKQERAKYHKLKYGTELNQGEMKPPSYDSDEGNEKDTPGSLSSQLWWKQGRQLLRQYLQEVGYMDTILDVKSQRVKALLGLMGDSSRTNQEPLSNGTDSAPKGANTGTVELSESSAVLEAFKFIESATAEFSDEDDEEDSDGRERTIVDSRTIVRKKPSSSSSSFSPTADVCDDLDTEDALKDFDFLSTSEDMDTSPDSRSADGTDWETDKQRSTSEAWDVDQGLITKLKEQYRKERKGKKGVKRPNRTKLQDMLANLRENEDASPLQSSVSPPSRLNANRFIEHDSSHANEVEAITFPPSSGKSFIMGGDDAVDSGELGLGELAGLTIANEADNLAYDCNCKLIWNECRPWPRTSSSTSLAPTPVGKRCVCLCVCVCVFPALIVFPSHCILKLFINTNKLTQSFCFPALPLPHSQIANNKDALRKTWNPKFSLRSHFDAIRGLAFHPIEPVLITASEDHTLKMWNLQKTVPAKKNASLDVEPIYTFRAHRGAVLCVVVNNTGDQCYSGGVDGTVQCWNTPSPNIDPYDSYQLSVLRGALSGHTDAVWGLVYSSAHQRLLSCSADGTVRLWNAANNEPAIAVFNEDKELGVPSSVDLVCSEPAYMVTSFTNGKIGLFNMETQQLVQSLECTTEPGASCQINKVLSHPTLPITITAQEDHHIKFYDNNTGKLVHSMVAHLDAVTSLAVDPNGLYLMSGSHDCSIRLWNLESKTCIQEFTAHRKKFEESIYDVAFHPSKCYIASAGADSLAKVFV